ncbi:MAG: ABC transporter substrate-binding protein [Peptococcaceae bacterium]
MNKNHLKKLISAAVLGMVVLTGCGANDAAPQEETAEPLRVGMLRVDDSFPFYVAEKEGLFEKHNVNVELKEFSNARDQSTALQGGELDVLMTDPVVTALSIKGGTDIRIVAMALGAVPEEGRFMVVSAPESGITAPEQLAGKRIAISTNTMMDYLVEQYETVLGLDKAAIDTVNMPDLMLRATTLLEGKDIDAAILPDPLASFAVMNGANVVIDDTQLDVNLSQSVIAITEEAITGNEGQVAALMAAYKEAIEMINQDPEAYRDYALECTNVPEGVTESYKTPTFTANSIPSQTDIAQINDWMVERGLLEEAYGYEEMVDNSFVK